MYITMNRFKIKKEHADDYINIWKEVQAKIMLSDVAGFLELKFFKIDSQKKEDYVLFASYARWENKETFLQWVKSDHFKQAHKTSGGNHHMYLEPPKLECFEVFS